MLNGYDISNNQGDIDNTQVPGDFVIIKATEGIGYTDANCDANYQQAKGDGKLVGVYHFARPDGNPSGADEAEWFLSQIQGYLKDGILVLDWEHTDGTADNTWNVGWAKAFLDRVYTKTGVRPWIYMSQSVANAHDWSSVWADYALWIAAYGANMPQNGYTPSTNISVEGDWVIAAWQYTSNGYLPGYGGRLDLNVFYGDREGWKRYADPAHTPPPVTTTTEVPDVTTTTTETTTATTTEVPATTTTTTEGLPLPTTTTTSTAEVPSTTSTTTEVPTPGFWLGFLAGVGAFIVWLIKFLGGKQ